MKQASTQKGDWLFFRFHNSLPVRWTSLRKRCLSSFFPSALHCSEALP